MKKLFFTSILLIILFIANSQTFSRLGVHLGENGMQTFVENNISPIHGFLDKDGYYVGEFNSENITKISESELPYHILIEDVQKYYLKERNSSSKISNVNPCFQGLGNYPPVENFDFGSMAGFYTLEEVIEELDNMHTLFPEIITAKTQIGSSVSIEGREIYWLKISDNPNIDEDEPQVLYTSVHHAQEPASVQQLIHYMYYLLENYDTNEEVQYLINNTEMYFIPMVNPDGYLHNQTENPNGGGLWRKNRRDNGSIIDGYGVDLNRNYDYAFAWDDIGSGSFGQHPWFRGEFAFSEPETQATKYFLENHNILLALNWHSYGDMLIYPWNYENHYTEDSIFYEIMSEEMTVENHYRSGTCYETYGYQSNGDADDWGYGEIASKNKVISLTGEAGNMDDGFWPDQNRIEDICRNTLRMNMAFAHLAHPFAKFTDLESYIISNETGEMNFEIHSVGLTSPASFTVGYQPLSSNITFNGSLIEFNDIPHLGKSLGTIDYQINAQPGENISYVVSVNNGNYSFNDTINKVFGYTEQLFFDPCENMINWNSDDWGVISTNPYEGTACINESPNENYGLLQTSELEPNQSFDLSGYTNAVASFRIRYKSENNYDYLEALVSSDNGSSWQPLCGRLSKVGTDDEDEGQPVYHGNMPEWSFEEIILDDFIGETIRIKLRFKSDQSHNYDGFYIDNFEIVALDQELVEIATLESNFLKVYPNPANQVLIVDNTDYESVYLIIYDISGKKVLDKHCKHGANMLNISHLEPGIYIWETVDTIKQKGKLIVE